MKGRDQGIAALIYTYCGGDEGQWKLASIRTVRGDGLNLVKRVLVAESTAPPEAGRTWTLRGAVSNLRYANATEQADLARAQPPLGRPEATRAALIPLRKSVAWWALAQDRRRAIFEESSRHIAIGLRYLPAVARRLHHSRDLGEPFDFLTWFEYAPADEQRFDELVAALRSTPEWRYVEREVDIRLDRS